MLQKVKTSQVSW